MGLLRFLFLYVTSIFFGNRILGRIQVGDLFIDWDHRENPFVDPIIIKKVLAISRTHLKYARYAESEKNFTYDGSDDIKSFMAFHAKIDAKQFADVLANRKVK